MKEKIEAVKVWIAGNKVAVMVAGAAVALAGFLYFKNRKKSGRR